VGNIRALPSVLVVSEMTNAITHISPTTVCLRKSVICRDLSSVMTRAEIKRVAWHAYSERLDPHQIAILYAIDPEDRGLRFDNLLKVINSLPLKWAGLICILGCGPLVGD